MHFPECLLFLFKNRKTNPTKELEGKKNKLVGKKLQSKANVDANN